MEKGCVVKSIAGHDKDRFYMLVEATGGYAVIADGKVRKLASPKRKNVKHLRPSTTVLDVLSVKTDKRLRELLKPFNDGLKGQAAPEEPDAGSGGSDTGFRIKTSAGI